MTRKLFCLLVRDGRGILSCMSQALTRAPYGNCVMLAHDGEMLCYCNEDKAEWYLSRSLATKESSKSNGGIVFRLKFEPKGRGNVGEPYYMTPKDNLCVVCGETSIFKLTRHHAVPWLFRRGFPDQYKKGASHDVLPVCIPCHKTYELEADKFKAKLGVELNLPIFPPHQYDKEQARIRSVANALVKYQSTIPAARKKELLALVIKYLGHYPTMDELIETSKMETESPEYIEWREKAANLVGGMSVAELRAFCRLWRKHFVDTMNPRFMQKHWDINHWKKEWIERYGE